MFDVIIVGGGIAGLSAALLLGRSCRRALVCDGNAPRNGASGALHGFLTQDGTDPHEMLRIAREQLRAYGNVEVQTALVRDAVRQGTGFRVALDNGIKYQARKLLLATGVVDELPAIEGIHAFYGSSVFHCPYCDGWEVRGAPLAAYGKGQTGLQVAMELLCWSEDVVLCTDGPPRLGDSSRQRLASQGIELRDEKIERLEGRDGQLERILFADGTSLVRRAMFFAPAWKQHSGLAVRLGCRLNEHGLVTARRDGSTEVPGLFVAGDASEGIQLAVVAAAEGARAALGINKELIKEDLAGRERVWRRQELQIG